MLTGDLWIFDKAIGEDPVSHAIGQPRFNMSHLNLSATFWSGIVCLIRMPSVKSFCHTSSAQMEKSQRGRGKGVIILFRVFLFYNWYFYGTTLHEIFAGVGSGMFTLKTNRQLDMDEPCLAGKVIIAIHSRVTLM